MYDSTTPAPVFFSFLLAAKPSDDFKISAKARSKSPPASSKNFCKASWTRRLPASSVLPNRWIWSYRFFYLFFRLFFRKARFIGRSEPAQYQRNHGRRIVVGRNGVFYILWVAVHV